MRTSFVFGSGMTIVLVMRTYRVVVLAAAVAVAGAACADDDDATAGTGSDRARTGGMLVVATTTQTADFTRLVGGDVVDVYDVIRANVDAHDYEPTAADLENLGDAKVVVRNGFGLEPWFDDTIAQADSTAVVVDASTGVTPRAGEGEEAGEEDPHIWMNPAHAKTMVTNITAGLVEADPAHQTAFEANRDAYLAQIDALDVELRGLLDTLPNRKLVTNHDAFGYYIDYYGLQFVGSVLPSFDTAVELTPSGIEELVAQIKAEGVKAIFTEASLPPAAAEALASEAGVTVVSGEDALYADSLGPEGSNGDTYLKMMRHNTRVIVENLT